MNWSAAKASRVLAALLRSGWSIKRQSGSHRVLQRAGWSDFVFAFHDQEEIGPRMQISEAVKPDRQYHLDGAVRIEPSTGF
jgi:predicted RNA binding protein YcfA (HicA-like mRNA interferase family)